MGLGMSKHRELWLSCLLLSTGNELLAWFLDEGFLVKNRSTYGTSQDYELN